jgi:hypothetical protein
MTSMEMKKLPNNVCQTVKGLRTWIFLMGHLPSWRFFVDVTPLAQRHKFATPQIVSILRDIGTQKMPVLALAPLAPPASLP